MTTDYMGMTPYEYGLWAQSRENSFGQGTGSMGDPDLRNSLGDSIRKRNQAEQAQKTLQQTEQNDAIAMASKARGLNALDYRYGMAGLPTPYQVPATSPQNAFQPTMTPGVQAGGYTPPAPPVTTQPYPAQPAVQATVHGKGGSSGKSRY